MSSLPSGGNFFFADFETPWCQICTRMPEMSDLCYLGKTRMYSKAGLLCNCSLFHLCGDYLWCTRLNCDVEFSCQNWHATLVNKSMQVRRVMEEDMGKQLKYRQISKLKYGWNNRWNIDVQILDVVLTTDTWLQWKICKSHVKTNKTNLKPRICCVIYHFCHHIC